MTSYDPRSRTPAGRAEQLAEGRAWLAGMICKQNELGMWDVGMKRAWREKTRGAVTGRLEDAMTDPRGRTPEGRAEQLAEIRAEAARGERRAQDARHMPGGGVGLPARVGYWDAAFGHADLVSGQVSRDLAYARSAADPFDDGEMAEVARLDGAWLAAVAERQRCKAERDRALDEFEQLRDGLRHRGW